MALTTGSVLGADETAVSFVRNAFLDTQSNPIREVRLPTRQPNTIAQANLLSTNDASRVVRDQATEAVPEVLSDVATQELGLLVERVV